MLTLKLALRNVLGAGLKTWLNVAALSFAFFAIVFMQGLYTGMGDQMEQATIDALYGGGQYWHASYDPYNPLELEDAHGTVPPELQALVDGRTATPILIRQAVTYPEGRFRSVLLKGIDPAQNILTVPSSLLTSEDGAIPAVIGTRMAKSTGLRKGDYATVQWRDVNGTFDAREIRIAEVFRSNVQTIDQSQFWIPLEQLRQLTGMPGEATMVVLSRDAQSIAAPDGWEFKDLDALLSDVRAMVQTKTIGGSIFYTILMFLAMLAIFDTQVLSIFRRKKEMGTLMALGMTRPHLIGLFTLEGAIHAVFATIVAAIYGTPLLIWISTAGWPLPEATDDFGFALGEKLLPVYPAGLIIGTTVLVLIVTTIVSFLPTRRIARLKPTDALRGKIS